MGVVEIDEPPNSSYKIADFYNDTTLFITGATGYVGKALVEKLLRSCRGIRKIYILIREKRGQSSEQRFKNYLKDQVFHRLYKECPDELGKLDCIPGDVTQPYLGIGSLHHQQLIEEVNIVFNCAATIKFNEPLFEAANLNALGAKRVMDLCCKMMNLKSLVHVSTAFSHPEIDVYEEQIYSCSQFEKDAFLKCMAVLKPEIINSLAHKFIGKAPNTYVFTKSLGEEIIADYKDKIPISIIRPSIITAAKDEPEPGYADNIQGINSLIISVLLGYVKAFHADNSCILDLIPLDTVVKSMIAVARLTSCEISKDLKVYNCVSEGINPVRMGQVASYVQRFTREYPSKYALTYPQIVIIKSDALAKLSSLIFEFLPAFVLDLMAKIKGSKAKMVYFYNKSQMFSKSVEFVVMRNFEYKCGNFKELCQKTKLATDHELFDLGIDTLNWEEQIKKNVIGLRRCVLREQDDTLEACRTRMNRIFWIQCAVIGLLIALLIYLVFTLFNTPTHS